MSKFFKVHFWTKLLFLQLFFFFHIVWCSFIFQLYFQLFSALFFFHILVLSLFTPSFLTSLFHFASEESDGKSNWKLTQTPIALYWPGAKLFFLKKRTTAHSSLLGPRGTYHFVGWAQCFAKLSKQWVQQKVGPSQNSGYEHFPSL